MKQNERRCAACGTVEVKGSNEFAWKMPTRIDEDPFDYYCDSCYQGFRLFEAAEEQIIAALKAADIHETYQVGHLQKVLDELAGLTPEAFASALERGTASQMQPVNPEAAAA